MKKIVLASGSPRRKELLSQLGLDFEIMISNTDESTTETDPAKVVELLSARKATAVAKEILDAGMVISSVDPAFRDLNDVVVLGSDTIVSFEGKILGKPRNDYDALKMLTMLQGQTHQVYTGVTFAFPVEGKAPITFAECTEVTMFPTSQAELLSYIATGEPKDKAGAYGIQGRGGFLVKEIHGDYNNVVGLPVSRVYQELKKL